MEVYSIVLNFLKKSIHAKDIDVQECFSSIHDKVTNNKIATDLLWIALSTVDYFYDDFDTIVYEPSMDVVLSLVDYFLEKGANVNGYISDQTIDKEPIYEYFEKQTVFIRFPRISLLVLAFIKKNEVLISKILPQVTSIHVDEIYVCFHIFHQERFVQPSLSWKMIDGLICHTRKLSSEIIEYMKHTILDKILNSNDVIGWDYYLKHLFSVNDDVYLPAIILCRSKAISLRLIEFLDKRFIRNFVTPHGNTFLHLACRAGHEQMVKVLLKKGIDWNHVNRHGETAMFWACKNGNPYIVYRLLKKGVRHSYDTLLGYSNRFNRPTVRKVILEFKYAKQWYNRVKVNILLKNHLFKGVEPMLVWKMVVLADSSSQKSVIQGIH